MGWNRARVLEAAATLPVIVAVLATFARFVQRVELRPGVRLADPVLAAIGPRDLTWPIFLVLYGALVLAIASLVRRPARLLAGVQAYAVMVLLRMAAMAVTPLDPPGDAIPLQDPLVRFFGPSQVLTRDLFFSGHTATCVMAMLAVLQPRRRALLAAATLAVASGVLVQHVHYTIDVLAAPPFAYLAWSLVGLARRRAGLDPPAAK